MSNNFASEDINVFDELAILFKKLVKIINPFYGCLASRINSKDMFGGYMNNMMPNSIFDLNYWDSNIIKNLHPISDYSSNVYEFEKINNGYYLRLQKELINVMNSNHIALQKKINDLIGLSRQ